MKIVTSIFTCLFINIAILHGMRLEQNKVPQNSIDDLRTIFQTIGDAYSKCSVALVKARVQTIGEALKNTDLTLTGLEEIRTKAKIFNFGMASGYAKSTVVEGKEQVKLSVLIDQFINTLTELITSHNFQDKQVAAYLSMLETSKIPEDICRKIAFPQGI